STETGAGQWGSALSLACNYFDLKCLVYMVRVSYDTKPFRKSMIETWGGKILPSPSNTTQVGRDILGRDPNTPGSLGIAISEAVEVAVGAEKTKYSLGSVLNHVLLHQTIIGEEVKIQLEKEGIEPDVIVGCVGGGSNFAGLAFPFLPDKFAGKEIEFIAAEPTACPTLTRGKFGYDFGDMAQLTPLLAMSSLGHTFMPAKIHAGGLRYHGMAPQISALVQQGFITPRAYTQIDSFKAAIQFARSEGIIPAPESSHAIAATIAEAKKADAEGVSKTIIFNLSGHGHFDMAAYDNYLSGNLTDFELSNQEIDKNLAVLPDIPLT
ncbi:MAG: TrpB-like pyridoxal phosphate-dependent enzyme, partial [Candidatus Marinimicrobia bacterium]|nr:TrpB-like pyridoxal phosphate-dependent enzyme [Candidatus Neomarinimicrobiota bacterium]